MARDILTVEEQSVYDIAVEQFGGLDNLYEVLRQAPSKDIDECLQQGIAMSLSDSSSVIAQRFVDQGVRLSTCPAPVKEIPFAEMLLARWTDQVSGTTVIDQEGRSELTPQQLQAWSANEISVIGSLPAGAGTVASIDFDFTDKFSVYMLLKSGETSSFNRIMSNRKWPSTNNGVDLSHGASGFFKAELYGNTSNRIERTFGIGVDINGLSKNPAALNDGNWHGVLLTYDGSGTKEGINIYGYDTTGTHIIKSTTAPTITGSLAGLSLASGVAWKFCNIETSTDNKDMQFQHVQFFGQELTHEEAISLLHHQEVARGKRRHYPLNEKIGATFFNSWITDQNNRLHGSCTDTGTHGRVNDGVWSHDNRYGFNQSSGVNIPFDRRTSNKDAQGTEIPLANIGKVKFDGLIIDAGTGEFKPNPNGYDELNNIGITSSTTYTPGGTLFANSELQKNLFKNPQETEFLAYVRDLRHWTDYTAALGQMGQAMAYVEAKIWLIAQTLSQSNTSGSNPSTPDFVDASYKDPIEWAWIANNPNGIVVQTVSKFEQYDWGTNDDGSAAGPDASMLKDIVDNGNIAPYIYKYSIGSTGWVTTTLNYWYPYAVSGNPNTHLYPLGRNGLREAITRMTSAGYENIEVVLFSDFCCESSSSKDRVTYKTEIVTGLVQFQIDFPEWKGKVLARRGHDAYHSTVPTGEAREAIDDFVAEEPANRKTWNTDSYATHDTNDVHFTLRGQEENGQDAAVQFLTFL